MTLDVQFDEFLPRDWQEAVRFAVRFQTRLPHFERYLEEREVDTVSSNNARALFDYVRLVVRYPLPSIEKHILAEPSVAKEYERFKKDVDPNNDGGGIVLSLVRRIWSPPRKKPLDEASNASRALKANTSDGDMDANGTSDKVFLKHVQTLLETQAESSFDATLRNVQTGRRHVARFHLVEDELLLASGVSWFSVDRNNEAKFVPVGQWPTGTDPEQVRRGWQIKKAVEQLKAPGAEKHLPASFKESAHPASQATMSMSGGELIVSFGQNEKQLVYETEAPYKRRELPSPAEMEATQRRSKENQRRIKEALQVHQARETNILRMLEQEPEGITDKDGYHYKLTDNGQAVQRTSWNGKSKDTFSLEEFDDMEVARLSNSKERSISNDLGMTR